MKGDGRIVEFDQVKIEKAILSAMKASDAIDDLKAKDIAGYIKAKYLDAENVAIEDIQDDVENALMACDPAVAKAYILYRGKRNDVRNFKSDFMQVVARKLEATDIQNQNANVDEASFGGRKGEATSEMLRRFALDYCMSDMARNNHLNNEIYIHDLDCYALGMHNCLTVPLDDLLREGFTTRQTDVRPAQSINSAFQLVAVIFQLQSLQQFGGVSASHIDHTMVPYVRKSFYRHYKDGLKHCYDEDVALPEEFDPTTMSIDDEEYRYNAKAYKYAMEMTERETYQAVEALYHNLNTLQSRSGNQLPFSSLNYGTCTDPEGRLIIKALLDVSITGIGKLHRTPVFPCGIFQCMKGVNRKPSDPNYDLFRLALRSTALRLYPNYANVEWSNNHGYMVKDPKTYFSTMGCRTANLYDMNGFGQLKDGRGNIAPVTIILPVLAMKAKEKAYGDNVVDVFMDILDTKIHEAKDMLIERYQLICSQDFKSARFMYENHLMKGYMPEEGIRSALKHGTLAIGQIGLAETIMLLIGSDHTNKAGMDLAIRIEKLFMERCNEFKHELRHDEDGYAYHLNFGVYFTPAENLCHTSMVKFREQYGVIEGVSDKSFFTNSIHVPVYRKLSPFTKIDIESKLTGFSSAGCITYVELDGAVKRNLDALEIIVQYAMDHDIPYFAINVPNDMCMTCGYMDELGNICPQCGNDEIQRLRRVTGYLTGDYKSAFNKGKQEEVEMRYRHSRELDRKLWKE